MLSMPLYYGTYPIDAVFERDYEVDVRFDAPTSKKIRTYVFNPAGAVIEVSPHDGEPFLVLVGMLSSLEFNTWPNSRCLLINKYFLLHIDDPASAHELPGFAGHGVHYMIPVPSRRLVVIGHCCAVYCYGEDGLRWSHGGDFIPNDAWQHKEIDVTQDRVTLIDLFDFDDAGERRYAGNGGVRMTFDIESGTLISRT